MGNSLLYCKDLSIYEIEEILNRARVFKMDCNNKERYYKYQNKFIANLFLEPSTRTRLSFEVAEKKLGSHVLNFVADSSSIQKGESINDTLRTLESLGVDVAVIRIKEELLASLSNDLKMKIINAGEGQKEHPTQALLDLFTIREHFTHVKDLNVAIIGDIAHSRVARSNTHLLRKLGANIKFSGPMNLMAKDLKGEYLPINEAIQWADVIMMLRIQQERMEESLLESKEEYNLKYGFTADRLKLLKPNAIILHPAPVNRGVEMDDSVVSNPQSKIFEQITNGVFIRLAVIERALEG